jgi:uncharacterized protein (DUF169 family)
MSQNVEEMDWRSLARRIEAALKPVAQPIAITFDSLAADGGFSDRTYPAAVNGRTGAVPAGCVFWIEATNRSFSTIASDHANCSVGSYTHGLLDAAGAMVKDDVSAIVAAGWVNQADFNALPKMPSAPGAIAYGPLADAVAPDVVLLRVNGLGLMTLKDAYPDLAITGKPQCHIVPQAFLGNAPAASVGCALSRARTGMRSEEMTCAVPARVFEAFVARVEAAVALDRAMARYAAQDAQRWDSR